MFLLKGATVFISNKFEKTDILIKGGLISKIGINIPKPTDADSICFENSEKLICLPGFVDVHTHLREPGFFYKESIASGTLAGASAGYTALCSMPNLNPVPDSLENLFVQKEIIDKTAKINVYPYGAITVGQKGQELADLEGMAPYVVGFSDDGHGVQNDEIMLKAMKLAKRLGKPIVAHCEDNSLLKGGYIHDGVYSKAHNHKGICSESEWKQLERDIELVRLSGTKYHVCHISTKESVQLIRKAKAEGLNISAETAPHYLVLTEENLKESGNFKMNPPLRSESDRAALIEGLIDGTIDVIATDHAPHSDEEKAKGLEKSAFGVIGLETAFSVLYTKLVKTNLLSMERLVDAMCIKPRLLFGLGNGQIKEGEPANLAVIDLSKKWLVKGKECLSKGSSTPFEGETLYAKNLYTFLNGEIVWKS